MRRRIYLYGALLLAAFGVLAWLLWPKAPEPLRASLVAEAAPADTSGFARAEGPVLSGVEGPPPLVFPADHGPHDDFQTEWWYYTGNLTAETGEHFGYQLTFFRRALTPPDQRSARDSAWAADQVYMAHLALTDVSGSKHYSFEKLARGAAGLAGAQAEPFRVWLEDWSVAGPSAGQTRLRAAAKDPASGLNLSLDLNLADLKGPILQGDRGYSRKGPEPGNASYYVSLPRIATEGTVTVGDEVFTVDGLSWMDHEWSTERAGRGAGRLGLVQHPARRQHRADAVPVAAGRWDGGRILQRHADRGGRLDAATWPRRLQHPVGRSMAQPAHGR